MDIKSSRAASVVEAKEILSKRKEDSELGYEQGQALENTEKFAKCNSDKVQELVGKLIKSGKISQELAIKIIDIGPDSPATLKAILAKDKIDLPEEEAVELLKDLA